MKQRTLNNQDGIALGPILFIIAILAIIAAAIAAGSGGFTANTTTESDKSKAELLLNYADAVDNGVQSLLTNGCEDTQLNFATSQVGPDFQNPNAPTDHSCDVFDPRGGNVVYASAPQYAAYWNNYGNWWQAGWVILGDVEFMNVGTTCGCGTGNDLAIGIMVTQGVCQQINNILGIPSIAVDSAVFFFGQSIGFGGTYPTSPTQHTINPGKT